MWSRSQLSWDDKEQPWIRTTSYLCTTSSLSSNCLSPSYWILQLIYHQLIYHLHIKVETHRISVFIEVETLILFTPMKITVAYEGVKLLVLLSWSFFSFHISSYLNLHIRYSYLELQTLLIDAYKSPLSVSPCKSSCSRCKFSNATIFYRRKII